MMLKRHTAIDSTSFPSLTHQGYIEAAALLFDFDVIEELESRRRILSLWRPGSKVFQLKNALVLLNRTPDSLQANACIGMPLVRVQAETHGTASANAPLSAMPITGKQLKELGAVCGKDVVRLKGGAVVCESLIGEVDPSEWIELDEFKLVEIAPVAAKIPELEEKIFDARARLPGVPSAAPELRALTEAVKAEQQAEEKRAADKAAGKQDGAGPGGGGLGETVDSLMRSAVDWANKTFNLGTHTASTPNRNQSGGASGTPIVDTKFLNDLKMNAYKLLASAGVLEMFAQQQQAYVFKMMEKFERGDWLEALKYAIPLGKGDGNGDLSLGVPQPRDSLKLTMGVDDAAGGSLLVSGPDLHERLRALYRSAFEHLAARGEIDQAAFVLAELLRETEEAVSFLERHKRFKVAAELAESRKLPPAVVARLWILAGNIERAITIARVRGVFAEVARLLEKSHPEEAKSLKRCWAEHLAASGDYAAAAFTAMQLEDMRSQSIMWTKRALALTDAAGGNLLATWLKYLDPEDWSIFKLEVQELLADESRERAPARVAFATHFTNVPDMPDPHYRTIARAATRALLRDRGFGYIHHNRKQIKNVARAASDAALTVDLNNCLFDVPITSIHSGNRLNLEVHYTDVGAERIYQAIFLPNGKVLAALGEGGMCLLNENGRVVKHFTAPAYHFVQSHKGDRVLAIAPRGPAMRITRVDTTTAIAEDWGEPEIETYSQTFDGSVWYVGVGENFYVVDATASQYKVLWKLPYSGGIGKQSILSIGSDDQSCSFILTSLRRQTERSRTEGQAFCEVLTCHGKGMHVSQRRSFRSTRASNEFDSGCWTSPQGRVVELTYKRLITKDFQVGGVVETRLLLNGSLIYSYAGVVECNLNLNNRWLVHAISEVPQQIIETDTGRDAVTTCSLVDLPSHGTRATIKFEGTRRVIPRVHNEYLTLCDDRGRILVIELAYGSIIRNFRL